MERKHWRIVAAIVIAISILYVLFATGNLSSESFDLNSESILIVMLVAVVSVAISNNL